MQKFKEEFQNVPTNASLVCSSTNLMLNREDTLSASNRLERSTLTLNNPEVNRVQQTGRSLKVFVFVLNMQGIPLMPCSYAKSKRLIKKGAAKVIKRFPFTIQLNFECENHTQNINLGIDSGYENIGFSASTEKQELISGTLILDGKTKERLEEKGIYRRGRRYKLWYRKSRFNNRKNKKIQLPPSIERKYQTHLNLIKKLKQILPISEIYIELGIFNVQKLENPHIRGAQYTQGNLYKYQNMRNYLFAKQNGKCLFCKKDLKGFSSHIHHIKSRNNNGNNRAENLTLSHKKCHVKIHKKSLDKNLKSNSKDYKQSTFMNIISKRFQKNLPDIIGIFGYVTSMKRNELGLEKTHFNDAFVIARGNNQIRCKSIEIKQIHRNNRVLQLNRKGFKPSIKKNKSKVNPGDLFWIGKKEYTCKGMFNYSRYILFGKMNKKEYFKFSEITKIFHFGSFAWNI